MLTLAVLLPVAAACVALGVTLWALGRDLPDVNALAAYHPSQTTEIWSSDGVLLARLFDENRRVVPLSGVAPVMRDATVAIEDHRFFEHRGVDWKGVGRALVRDVQGGGYDQGGSTLTQQLVRRVFLRPDKRLKRKAKEALLALAVERRFSKPDILAMYLNQVYYGNRAFGVQAAARTYFGKDAGQLSVAEAAMLAGIPQRPGLYDPWANPQATIQRRDTVLRRMAETGFLPQHAANAAMQEPLRLFSARPPRLTARRAPYFVDYVVRQLEDRYGAEMLYRGGLQVQTTLNTRAQTAAEEAVAAGMARSFPHRATQCALLSLDPRNGYIRAMVGGRDYHASSFNRAVQAKRQPGSAFKAFVYSAAFTAGMQPDDRITDAPVSFARWHWNPHNYDLKWHGQVTLTHAFAESINIPAVKLCDMVGAGTVANTARACGITSPLQENLTLALGTSEVSMLEITSAYGVFPTGGNRTPPLSVLTVQDAHGDILESNNPAPEPALDTGVVHRMDGLFRAVVLEGTGRAAGVVPEARGKTGTSDNLRDAWFIGYTPELVTSVWIGNDRPSRIPGVTGGGVCAPIWAAYTRRALLILPRQPVPKPAPPSKTPPSKGAKITVAENQMPAPGSLTHPAGQGMPESASSPPAPTPNTQDPTPPPVPTVNVRVCSETGLLATPACPQTEVQAFIKGTEPTTPCTLHTGQPQRTIHLRHGLADLTGQDAGRTILVCRESGGLATNACPNVVTRRLRPGDAMPAPCPIHGVVRGPAVPADAPEQGAAPGP